MRAQLYDGTEQSLEWLRADKEVKEIQHSIKLGMCEIILKDDNYFTVQIGDFICKNEYKEFEVIDIEHNIYKILAEKGLSRKESVFFIKNMNDGRCY